MKTELKKVEKQLFTALVAATLCVSLSACGGAGGDAGGDAQSGAGTSAAAGGTQTAAAPELLNFWSESGSYSVRIPDIEGGWVQSDGGNEEHLVLDNSDQTFSILVQGLPKDSEQFSSLDTLMEFYREQTLSSFGAPTSEEVAVDPSLTAKAESYSVTQEGVTAKALVIFLEGANSYYVYTITGLEEQYDANIDAQRAAVVNFVESVG